jgi:hypothetical protein
MYVGFTDGGGDRPHRARWRGRALSLARAGVDRPAGSAAARAVASFKIPAMAVAKGAKTRSISRRRGNTCGQRGSDASRKCSLSGWNE